MILLTFRERGKLQLMTKRSETPAFDEAAELRREIADLKDQVKVLTDVLDEIRDDIQWVTRNGLPLRTPHAVSPVLKQMALDPLAEDWGERLQIVRQASNEAEGEIQPTQSTTPQSQAAEKPSSQSGEQRRLF
jgi:hypothetical protein